MVGPTGAYPHVEEWNAFTRKGGFDTFQRLQMGLCEECSRIRE